MDIHISDHARFEAERRGIPIDTIIKVALSPQQEIASGKRKICQSKLFNLSVGKEMLLRVVVQELKESLLIITVYETSKIEKYWRA